MYIQGLILGKGEIITDGRVLSAMARHNFIKYPIDKGHPYVDEENRPRNFMYKKQEYRIEYFSGCFYPFVTIE
jgi:hypothetical protein